MQVTGWLRSHQTAGPEACRAPLPGGPAPLKTACLGYGLPTRLIITIMLQGVCIQDVQWSDSHFPGRTHISLTLGGFCLITKVPRQATSWQQACNGTLQTMPKCTGLALDTHSRSSPPSSHGHNGCSLCSIPIFILTDAPHITWNVFSFIRFCGTQYTGSSRLCNMGCGRHQCTPLPTHHASEHVARAPVHVGSK